MPLACFPGRPILDSPGHDSAYFSHYHPGGVHPKYEPRHPKAKSGPGHVFFGDRDESWKTEEQAHLGIPVIQNATEFSISFFSVSVLGSNSFSAKTPEPTYRTIGP